MLIKTCDNKIKKVPLAVEGRMAITNKSAAKYGDTLAKKEKNRGILRLRDKSELELELELAASTK